MKTLKTLNFFLLLTMAVVAGTWLYFCLSHGLHSSPATKVEATIFKHMSTFFSVIIVLYWIAGQDALTGLSKRVKELKTANKVLFETGQRSVEMARQGIEDAKLNRNDLVDRIHDLTRYNEKLKKTIEDLNLSIECREEDYEILEGLCCKFKTDLSKVQSDFNRSEINLNKSRHTNSMLRDINEGYRQREEENKALLLNVVDLQFGLLRKLPDAENNELILTGQDYSGLSDKDVAAFVKGDLGNEKS